MWTAGVLDLEFGFDDVGFAATEERFAIGLSLGMPFVVGTHEAFQPLLVRPVMRNACAGEHAIYRRDAQSRAQTRLQHGERRESGNERLHGASPLLIPAD